MNVLIYNGPGTSKLALSGAQASLTALLSPFYSVRQISPESLLLEPWTASTALLVVPGGRDLPYCRALNGAATRKIEEYIRRGGRYLGFCAGAYFASKRVEFEVGTGMEVSGPRELALFPGVARGAAFPGFVYDSEEGARVVKVAVVVPRELDAELGQLSLGNHSTKLTVKDEEQEEQKTKTMLGIYWNGGGTFVDAASVPGTQVLATYEEAIKVQGGSAAVIAMRHGQGRVVLSGVHPEMSCKNMEARLRRSSSPAKSIENCSKTQALNPSVSAFVPEVGRKAADAHAMYIQKMRSSSSSISIQSPESFKSRSSSPTSGRTSPQASGKLDPQASSFTPQAEAKLIDASWQQDRMTLLRLMLQSLELKANDQLESQPQLSTLYLLCYSERNRAPIVDVLKALVTSQTRGTSLIKSDTDTFALLAHGVDRPNILQSEELAFEDQIKYISIDRHPPHLPLFDTSNFFRLLHRLHYSSQVVSKTYPEPLFGTALLYGETVTSSQSLLDKNFSLQKHLPNGFTILCSHQLAGRGRGQNSWISPAGVLSFSSILHHRPASGESAGSVVLIQYLVSLAVADAILQLRPQLKIRIKWPNDIYMQVPDGIESSGSIFEIAGQRYAKISGSLITSSWFGGKYIMTLGIGINVSNPHPTISLNAVLPEQDAISLEELFANILVTFGNYYKRFVDARASFAPFEKRYYELWLHDSQSVKIEATQESGVVEGINLRDGTLRVSTSRGEIGLQADGNSFDMMKGLLKVKI